MYEHKANKQDTSNLKRQNHSIQKKNKQNKAEMRNGSRNLGIYSSFLYFVLSLKFNGI